MKWKKFPPSACFYPSCTSLGTGFMISPPFFGWICFSVLHQSIRWGSPPLTVTSEHKLVSTSSLFPFQAGKADCIWHSIFKGFVSSQWHYSSPGDKVLSLWGNPGVQGLANSSDFLMSFWLHFVLPGFSRSASLPNPFVLAHQASLDMPTKGNNLYPSLFYLVAQFWQ